MAGVLEARLCCRAVPDYLPATVGAMVLHALVDGVTGLISADLDQRELHCRLRGDTSTSAGSSVEKHQSSSDE